MYIAVVVVVVVARATIGNNAPEGTDDDDYRKIRVLSDERKNVITVDRIVKMGRIECGARLDLHTERPTNVQS